MKAIDEGLYEVAETVSDKDVVTGERNLNFQDRQSQISKSLDTEKDIINNIIQSGGKINSDLDADAYEKLSSIFYKVISVSHLKNESWKVYLIPYEGFNAFVIGGNSIFVHHDLIKQVENDDELAIVIGHEIAHVAANHIYEREAQFITLTLAGSKNVSKEGYLPSYIIKDEKEADMIGIMYATLAGFDPNSASELWTRLSKDESNLTLYYKSHPKSIERASYNASYANEVMKYYVQRETNPEADQILDCNELWCKKDNELKPGEGGGLLALLTVVANSLIEHGQAKYERDQQGIEIAQSQYEQQKQIITQSQNQIAKTNNEIQQQHATLKQPAQTSDTRTDSTNGIYTYEDIYPSHQNVENIDQYEQVNSIEQNVLNEDNYPSHQDVKNIDHYEQINSIEQNVLKAKVLTTLPNNSKIFENEYIGTIFFDWYQDELSATTKFSIDDDHNLIGTYEFIFDNHKYLGELKDPKILNNRSIEFSYHDDFSYGQVRFRFTRDGLDFNGNIKNFTNITPVKPKKITHNDGKYRNISSSGKWNGILFGGH